MEIGVDQAIDIINKSGEWMSAIGHADTAHLVSVELGVNIPANRINVNLQSDDRVLVAQYNGPRLPEGTTELPDGAKIQFCMVEKVSK